MYNFIACLGLGFFMLVAWALSENRKVVSWRVIGWGLGLQFFIALLILRTDFGVMVFTLSRNIVNGLLAFSEEGASLMFGKLSSDPSLGALFAFRILPVIIFVSSLMAVLWYLRITQTVVRGLSWLMYRTMTISGLEAFVSALFIFMGIETTTAIKAYINKMTRSELFTLMCAFMATIAGSVMVIYTSFGVEAGHLLAASVMSAPAAIVIAKLMVPETEKAETDGTHKVELLVEYDNPIEAAASGAADGLKLALNVGAMVLAFVSLIALINYPLEQIGTSLQQLIGYLMRPFAFFMGVPFKDVSSVAELIGTKTAINEFIAYMSMSGMIEKSILQPRSIMIATYALCGFANFGSLAILIAALGTLAPERKKEVASLGIKALLAGTLAAFCTGAIAGIITA